MRRLLDQQPQNQKLFRGSEFLRMMTMIVMLCVVWSLISTARNPSTWKFLAQEAENDSYTLSDLRKLEAAKQHTQVALAGVAQSTDAGERKADGVQDNKSAEPATPEIAKSTAERGDPGNDEAKPAPDKPEPAGSGDRTATTKAEAAVNQPSPAKEPAAPVADKSEPAKTNEEVESASQAPQRQYDPQPLDLDPEQQRRIENEFQAIQDKRPLSKEEMPAYWRLMRWQWGQSTNTLRERARKDVYFTHLWQKPEKFRGQLIRMRIHIKRIMTDTSDENIPGVTRMYDAWATTDDAPNQPSVVAFCDLPSDKMPLGPGIEEEAVFYGYFFKLLGYTSKDDKFRAAPMLIGRIVWYPTAPPPPPSDWTWPLVIGGGLVVLVGARVIFMLLKPKQRQPVVNRGIRLNDSGEEAVPVEDWLDQAEEPVEVDERPTNGHQYLDHPRNGSITHPRFSADYDRKEDELN